MRAEAAFESQCLKDLSALGYLVHSLPDAQANRRQLGDSGSPDIHGAGRGLVLFIECKLPKNKRGDIELRADQMEWQRCIGNAITMADSWRASDDGMIFRSENLLYAVATPDNWDAILEELA